jgi:hypothetical protein
LKRDFVAHGRRPYEGIIPQIDRRRKSIFRRIGRRGAIDVSTDPWVR